MHERRSGVENLADADGERGEHRLAIVIGMTVERFVDMLEARLHRDSVTGQQRELGRSMREALQSSKTMIRGELTDRVHPGVKR